MDVEAVLFSGLAGVLVSAEPGAVDRAAGGAAGGATGGTAVVTTGAVARRASAPSMGCAVIKGAANVVRGDSPSSVVPSNGLDAGRVRMYASANASRFCKASRDGRRPRRRVFSWSSRHADRMTQGWDEELGGSNVRPRSLRGYAGWVTMRRACSQLLTGRLGSR